MANVPFCTLPVRSLSHISHSTKYGGAANLFHHAAQWVSNECEGAASLRSYIDSVLLPKLVLEVSNIESVDIPKLSSSESVLGETLAAEFGMSDAAVDVFKRYDRYFGLRRVVAADSDSVLAQLMTTSKLVVADIRDAPIDLAEHRAIYRALAVSFGSVGVADATSGIVSSPHEDGRTYNLDIPAVGSERRAAALYRWKLSHHLFNLLTTMATGYLHTASQSADELVVSEGFDRAADLLRGTTAAMWYGEAWAPTLYADYIRPTMALARGGTSGFSGRDNLEFTHFRTAADDSVQTVVDRFGDSSDRPEVITEAVLRFLDARVLDLEHHTILAEKVVGNKASLKQEAIQAAMQARSRAAADLPAVESLRGLAARARDQKDAFLDG